MDNFWSVSLKLFREKFYLLDYTSKIACMSKGKQPRTRVKVPKLLVKWN